MLGKFPGELYSGQAYVHEDEGKIHVFIILEDRLLGRSGVGFDLEYGE